MPDTKTTGLSFRYLNQTYEIPASYNRNLIRYYQDYPSTDMHVFFSAAVAPEVENSLAEGLRVLTLLLHPQPMLPRPLLHRPLPPQMRQSRPPRRI